MFFSSVVPCKWPIGHNRLVIIIRKIDKETLEFQPFRSEQSFQTSIAVEFMLIAAGRIGFNRTQPLDGYSAEEL